MWEVREVLLGPHFRRGVVRGAINCVGKCRAGGWGLQAGDGCDLDLSLLLCSYPIEKSQMWLRLPVAFPVE